MAGGEDPLFLHASSRSPFLGSRSMVNFGGFRCSNGSIQRQFDYQESVLEDELEEYLNYQPEKKRRLSVEQVRFLEKCFELENKLEPERKIQLANDLGLQPRQISIWFQNRRARWKTKQLENDYANLKAGYDILKADYENLVKDKDKLKREISLLTDKLLDKEKGKTSCSKISTPNSKRDEPQKPTAESLSEYEVAKPVGKQEEINSTNTVDFDSDSLREYSNGIQFKAARDSFCHVFEHEQSDLSQDEDREFSKTQFPHCVFPKVEDVNCSDPLVASGSFAEDTAFWSWTY